jgi:hypothetical protein
VDGYDDGDYIDCTECGHAVEDHRTDGCHAPLDEPCDCTVSWTINAIMALRVSVGLAAEWRNGS